MLAIHGASPYTIDMKDTQSTKEQGMKDFDPMREILKSRPVMTPSRLEAQRKRQEKAEAWRAARRKARMGRA